MSEKPERINSWNSADIELSKHVAGGVAANLIEDDPEENQALVRLFISGERVGRDCVITGPGKRDPYAKNAWACCPSLRGVARRTIYKGTLYQCCVARDCFQHLREPYAIRPYGSRPGESRVSWFLREEILSKGLLDSKPEVLNFFNWMVLRFLDQGLLKPRVWYKSGPTIRKEKPIPGLQMQALLLDALADLHNQFADILNRLDGVEKLLCAAENRRIHTCDCKGPGGSAPVQTLPLDNIPPQEAIEALGGNAL